MFVALSLNASSPTSISVSDPAVESEMFSVLKLMLTLSGTGSDGSLI